MGHKICKFCMGESARKCQESKVESGAGGNLWVRATGGETWGWICRNGGATSSNFTLAEVRIGYGRWRVPKTMETISHVPQALLQHDLIIPNHEVVSPLNLDCPMTF